VLVHGAFAHSGGTVGLVPPGLLPSEIVTGEPEPLLADLRRRGRGAPLGEPGGDEPVDGRAACPPEPAAGRR